MNNQEVCYSYAVTVIAYNSSWHQNTVKAYTYLNTYNNEQWISPLDVANVATIYV